MIINEEFESTLMKFEAKNSEGCIESHIVLNHENLESNQNFLTSLDSNFGTQCMQNFEDKSWKNINYNLGISNLKLKFGGLEFKAQLTTIGISRAETKNGLKTKYAIGFKLDEPKTNDTIRIEYSLREFLKRSEPNDKGKMELVKFKTFLTKLF